MAVRTGPIHESNIGFGPVGQVALRQQLGRVPTLRMTLLAQDRPRNDEELFVVRTMGRMAGKAAFAHGSMFKQEWTTLLGVAVVASLVDTVGLEQRLRRAAVRVVAVDACNFSLEQRHVRASRELCALRLMALDAGFIDRPTRGQSFDGETCHRIVAIAAAEIVTLVNRAWPEDTLPAAMTVQALRILLGNRNLAPLGKANNAEGRGRILYVHRSGAMAGFTPFLLQLVARIKPEDFRVDRMCPVLCLLRVARDTDLLSDKGSLIGTRGCRSCLRSRKTYAGHLAARRSGCIQIRCNLMSEIGTRARRILVQLLQIRGAITRISVGRLSVSDIEVRRDLGRETIREQREFMGIRAHWAEEY